jgi:uncharacterized damage-inducible protein DinB
MKEILVQYTKYNVWANKLLIAILATLSDEDVNKDLGGSFPSIRKTAEHIWLAESVWLQRLQMAEKVIVPTDDFTGSFTESCQEWIKCSEGLLQFAEKIYDERGVVHEFHYQNIKGENFKSNVSDCLQHVCNHSTFHRGQLVVYLRQLGISKIPSTDFITFCRGKK